jgi:hypothetical protein
MKTLLLILLFSQSIQNNPILILDVQIKRPSIHARVHERPSLEMTLSNLSDKPIHSLTFEIEFWDYRHDRKADKIKGALGDVNPKFILLKPGQKKTIKHSLGDYYPPDSWSTDKTKLKIKYIKFSDGSEWINTEKNK